MPASSALEVRDAIVETLRASVSVQVYDSPTEGSFLPPCIFVLPGSPWWAVGSDDRTMGPTITGRRWQWEVTVFTSSGLDDPFVSVIDLMEEVVSAISGDPCLGDQVLYATPVSASPSEVREIGGKELPVAIVYVLVRT